jgi:hypothetical protein
MRHNPHPERKARASRRALALADELGTPAAGSAPLRFESTYARGWLQQFRTCLWKDNLLMWRSPEYNSVRWVARWPHWFFNKLF